MRINDEYLDRVLLGVRVRQIGKELEGWKAYLKPI